MNKIVKFYALKEHVVGDSNVYRHLDERNSIWGNTKQTASELVLTVSSIPRVIVEST